MLVLVMVLLALCIVAIDDIHYVREALVVVVGEIFVLRNIYVENISCV